MKKLRTTLTAAAIITGIGGAIAASSLPAPVLYYKTSNGTFAPAGIENYDFICQWDHFSTCTYTYNATTGQYQEYKPGKILWLR